MSIEGIIQRIEKDASAEAERIRREYAAKISDIEKKFNSERERAISDAKNRAKRERQKAHQRAIDHAKLMLSQKILSKKMEIFKKLFDEIEQFLKNLPEDEYREFFANVLLKLGQNRGTIVVAADRDILNDEFLKLVNDKITESTGEKPDFTLKTENGNWKGFYLIQEKVRYNATLEAVMQSVREEMENDIMKELFIS
ncbi:V-type ATP synthase subunit E [bacterium]|nr:V-type ATP synthase subunit E [bacterium]